jgi:hypothetical protein
MPPDVEAVAAERRWWPMAREVRNIGASVQARLLDRARAESADFQILLTRYPLERLLYRLSRSAQRRSASVSFWKSRCC